MTSIEKILTEKFGQSRIVYWWDKNEFQVAFVALNVNVLEF